MHFRGLFQPKLDDGESAALMIRSVHQDLAVADDAGSEGLGPAVVPHTDGAAKVTNRRLILAGNFRNVVNTWWWRDVAAVRVLRPAMGVRIERRDGHVDRVGSVWHSTVPGARPEDDAVIAQWLEVEAAFAASEGPAAFDAWFEALPDRLTSGLR